ncbi:MAG: formylglycine-generating enzyme family protein [Anaerohalosphaera sp.]|nr:formylglycine-generating enzyme family protein [Anaerohalosphaera sp.]
MSAKKFSPVEFNKLTHPVSHKIDTLLFMEKDSYVMKIAYKGDNDAWPSIVKLNGKTLDVDRITFNEVNRKKRVYAFVDSGLVHDGNNKLEVSFDREQPAKCIIYAYNYRKAYTARLFLRFKDDKWLSGNWLIYAVGIASGLFLLSIIKFKIDAAESEFKASPLQRGIIFYLCLFFVIVLIVNLTSGYYAVIARPFLSWTTFILLLLPVFVFRQIFFHSGYIPFFKEKTHQLFIEEEKITISAKVFSIVTLSLLTAAVYWPSFSHLFRHDDWFLFFSSKDEPTGLKFFLSHIDWQLHLPYDRLMFRPLHHGMLAFNRVVFGESYVAGHISTVLKHIITTFCFLALMLQHSKRKISFLIALLFAVAVTKIDAVIWPHMDGYILTTLLLILSIIVFRKINDDQLTVKAGTLLLSLLLFLNLLCTEIAFPVPAVMFVSYWLLFRKPNDPARRQKDKASFVWLLCPFLLWFILLLVHLYFAYPNLAMTVQSESIGLFAPILNVFKMLLFVFSTLIFPFWGQAQYTDKVVFQVTALGIVVTTFLLIIIFRRKEKYLVKIDPNALMVVLILLSISGLMCLGRAAMIDTRLSNHVIFTHYSYCLTALLLYLVYMMIDFDKLLKFNSYLVLTSCLAILILYHSCISFQICREVSRQTSSLKNYYDSTRTFIHQHETENDFSIRILDRCPEIHAFGWYHETCIDGLFNRYIDNSSPKYILEYDYQKEKLIYSAFSGQTIDVQVETDHDNGNASADLYNYIGIGFDNYRIAGNELMVGISEVTQQQWKRVMDVNPSRFINDRFPVENVSYLDVLRFIEILNQNDKTLVYRLPTIDEYMSLAERLESDFEDEPTQEQINKYAWNISNSSERTNPVGSFRATPGCPNDLIGNVWEWTSTPIQNDSPVKCLEDTPRKCFGGSWRDRCSDFAELQTNYPVDFRHEHLGFRLVAEKGGKVMDHRGSGVE